MKAETQVIQISELADKDFKIIMFRNIEKKGTRAVRRWRIILENWSVCVCVCVCVSNIVETKFFLTIRTQWMFLKTY